MGHINDFNFKTFLSLFTGIMVTILANTLMPFFDRVVLSYHSTTALHGVTVVSTVCLIFQITASTITSISDIFVGQYYGAKDYQRICSSVWQMIWFALSLFTLSLPLATFAGPYLIPEEIYQHVDQYYWWLMCFFPLTSLCSALASFFIGIRKIYIVAFIGILSNLIHLGLDIILVFGIEGYIPALGPQGAGIATVVALCWQLLVLIGLFLHPTYKRLFHTSRYHFDSAHFIQCLRIGFPNALSNFLETCAWVVILYIVTDIDHTHVMFAVVGHSCLLVLSSIIDGLEQTTTVLTANSLGGRSYAALNKLLYYSYSTHGIIVLCTSCVIFYPSSTLWLANFFINTPVEPTFISQLTPVFQWCVIYFAFEGLVAIAIGFLIATGDTLFIMFTNSVTLWLGAVCPLYLITHLYNTHPSITWVLLISYSLVNFMILGKRLLCMRRCLHLRFSRKEDDKQNQSHT